MAYLCTVAKRRGRVPKTNLCIIGLPKQFTDTVSKAMAEQMEMFYANIDDLFTYELIDSAHIEEVCGLEYLHKEEYSIVKRICTYDNTLIFIDYALLNRPEILKVVSDNCLLLFLSVNKDRYITLLDRSGLGDTMITINQDVFHDRDSICRSIADIIVECEELSEVDIIEKTIKQIISYYSLKN